MSLLMSMFLHYDRIFTFKCVEINVVNIDAFTIEHILFLFFRPMMPFTLNLLIDYFAKERTPESYMYAHIYNILMIFFTTLGPILLAHVELLEGCVGMRVRIACCSLLYRKVSTFNRLKILSLYILGNCPHNLNIY